MGLLHFNSLKREFRSTLTIGFSHNKSYSVFKSDYKNPFQVIFRHGIGEQQTCCLPCLIVDDKVKEL